MIANIMEERPVLAVAVYPQLQETKTHDKFVGVDQPGTECCVFGFVLCCSVARAKLASELILMKTCSIKCEKKPK